MKNVYLVSYVKNGDWLRPTLKIHWDKTSREVPVPVFHEVGVI